MSKVSIEIGNQIRNHRKRKKMTLVQLAEKISKSKATVSKYEKGEIVVDVETLYDIAGALKINVEQLLYQRQDDQSTFQKSSNPAFFNDISKFYSYIYDGRSNKIIRCVFDILSENNDGKYKIIMYMNFKDFNDYQNCENTYIGYMEHFDALTNIFMTNSNTEMEKVSINILASFLDSNTKWGLFCGISSRPMMPIAVKMLFSKKVLNEDDELIKLLKVSKEDIRLLKLYNMLSAT